MKKTILFLAIVITGGFLCRSNTIRGAADSNSGGFAGGVGSAVQIAQFEHGEQWTDAVHQGQEASKRQKEEIDRIDSIDPWRAINDGTNFAGGPGWFEFQGVVLSHTGDGVILSGTWGPITTVHADLATGIGGTLLLTSLGVSPSSSILGGALLATGFGGRLGPREFLVKNLPADRIQVLDTVQPTTRPNQRPVHTIIHYVVERMAFDAGTQTSSSSTMQVLDYGTPCVKRWSMKEMLAVKDSYERPYLNSLNANLKASVEDKGYNQISALMLMSQRYLEGNWVIKDLDKSGAFITNALAVEHDRPVVEMDALQNLESIKQSLENDKISAAAGNAEALYRMGKHYLNGRIDDGVTKDVYTALDFFKRGAAAGSTDAETAWHQLQAHLEADRDLDERLANQNDPDALFRRGQNYLCGHPEIGISRDAEKARADFYSGMVNGSPNAAFALGQLASPTGLGGIQN